MQRRNRSKIKMAEVRPVTRLQNGRTVLEQVRLEGHDPERGPQILRLTPDQLLDLHARFSQIAVAYLHENRQGGEDARDQ